jgi:hypothetical protein
MAWCILQIAIMEIVAGLIIYADPTTPPMVIGFAGLCAALLVTITANKLSSLFGRLIGPNSD